MSSELPETLNANFIDAQYQLWKTKADSVSESWQFFFKGFEIAHTQGLQLEDTVAFRHVFLQAGVESLIRRYRDIGHLLGCMDPLSACPTEHPLLDLKEFNLSIEDLEKEFYTPQLPKIDKAPLKEIINHLKQTYCRSIGVEYMHIQNPEERRWLQERMEPVRNTPTISNEQKRNILKRLTQSTLFEEYLNKKYVGVTRFSLEGGDAVIPLLDTVVTRLASLGYKEIILGMAHRGRLNVQAHILQKSYFDIFGEFESCYDPDQIDGSGDVKYHNGYLADINSAQGIPLRVFLVNNPSHLEAVDPVVQGIARARQDIIGGGEHSVVPVLIHGDAAFAGQGIVCETLNMSQLKGYKTGGTLHIVINNQIGYTTLPEDARSTRYSTDVAKMLMVPIFHVHGENPEAVVHVAELAADYRHRFQKDVVIDVICYRRYGHNEGDEPYFTQPLMYDRIRKRPPLSRIYAEKLLEAGVLSQEALKTMEEAQFSDLDSAFEEIHGSACPFPESRFYENWQGYTGTYTHDPIQTGVAQDKLIRLAKQLNTLPKDFALHRKLKKLLKKRRETVEEGRGIDWATGEALAMASLLTNGYPIRFSGQDVGRGTFSQRHSVLTDTQTGKPFIPLNSLANGQAEFQIFNSHLSEAGVLGFEYGYSMIQPQGLTIWEAQFGDFANNAQGIIDLFIASGETKWERLSGLTLLLPHGWEGLGPEHSSARLERFLQLCAEDNIQVCNLTTPAQYFHLLRRQMISKWRKPLVIMTPKSLLRHPSAVSGIEEMTTGSFLEVMDDDGIEHAERVIFCSGKIFYQLLAHRTEIAANDTAIIRIEQLYPFPEVQLRRLCQTRRKVKEWIWVQEEPENMGAWQFIRSRLAKIVSSHLTYAGRKPSASPATGFPAIYKQEQAAVSQAAFNGTGEG
jgi:2-oxoglutarate dehydrogenase E1 component